MGINHSEVKETPQSRGQTEGEFRKRVEWNLACIVRPLDRNCFWEICKCFEASGMDDVCETERQEELVMVSLDSAYGSSVIDPDAEDGQTPPSNVYPYNEELTHKVDK